MTEKLYYKNSKLYTFCATVLSCETAGDRFLCVLDKTAFFPEGGGQKADTGTIDDANVLDVQEKNGMIIHTTDKPLTAGTTVHGALNEEQRFRRMQNHTGEHIFSGVVHNAYGYTNVGFHMADDCMTVDFDGILNAEQLKEIEDECNRVIAKNVNVNCIFPTAEELANLDYRSKLELTEDVRLVEIEGVDLCACCAPHVEMTGEVGILKILDCMPHRGGTRITLVCGLDAFEHLRTHYNCNRKVSALLSARAVETPQGVEKLQEDIVSLKREITALQTKINRQLADGVKQTDGSVVLFVQDAKADDMRSLCNLCIEKCGQMMCVCSGNDETGYSYIIGSATINLREKSKEINAALNGRGGGQPTMIQGSFKATQEEIISFFNQP
ncbi:MAG: hypothetical protein E7523_02530 [Ruminococcaceae bacterium]|nr:hypothetical protein [Oscillospiraceae bacterium]